MNPKHLMIMEEDGVFPSCPETVTDKLLDLWFERGASHFRREEIPMHMSSLSAR